jgi:hypothetical protein
VFDYWKSLEFNVSISVYPIIKEFAFHICNALLEKIFDDY